jgi:teichuronic acid exporter
MTTSFRGQVLQAFAWTGAGQTAGQLAAWLATLVIIRLLEPDDYGLMAMATVFLGFFYMVADLGLGAAVVQAKSLSRDELREMFGIVIAANVAGFLLMIAAAGLVADYFNDTRLASVIRVLAFTFLLLAAFTIPQSQLVRRLEFRLKAKVDLGAVVVSAVVGVAMAATGFGVWALVGSTLAHYGAKAIAFNLLQPVLLVPTLPRSLRTAHVGFGGLVLLDRVLFYVFGQIGIIIGGRMLSTGDLGLYAVAVSLALVPLQKFLPIITQVSFAAYSRIQGDRERVARNVLRSVEVVSLVTFPAFLGLAAVAGDFVPVVLGERWMELVIPLQLLSLALPLSALMALFPPALFGIGRAATNVINGAISLGIISTTMLVGARYGVIGLCLAWTVGFPPIFAVVSFRSLRALGVSGTEFVKRLWFPMLASLVMAIALLWLRTILAVPETLRLGILIAAGVVIYGSLALITQRRTLRGLMDAARG